MKICAFIFTIILNFNNIYSQNTEIKIFDLKPVVDDNKFPFIEYKKNLRVEEKINIFLQLEYLEHLPNKFKNNPFEKIAFDKNNCCGSVSFYEWKKNNSPKNILSITIKGSSTGAYPEDFEQYQNFDLRTGNQIILSNIFSNNGLEEITKILNLKVNNRIQKYLSEIKFSLKNNNNTADEKETIEQQIELYEDCIQFVNDNNLNYPIYYFEKDSIQFVRGRCSSHAIRAIDDLSEYKNSFSYNEVNKYLSTYGTNLINGSSENIICQNPEAKFYKGKINNKYLITCLLSKINADNSLKMNYWYDKTLLPIIWRGNFKNNHFSLIEYDGEKQGWIIKAKIEAKLINDKIVGTWTNIETNEIFKIDLTEY